MAYQLTYQGKAVKTFKTRRDLQMWLSNNWSKVIERPEDMTDYSAHMERAARAWYGWHILKI